MARMSSDLRGHVDERVNQLGREVAGKLDGITHAMAAQGARIDVQDVRVDKLEKQVAVITERL